MRLRIITSVAAAAALAASLSACGTLGIGQAGAGGGASWANAVVEIAKDPACGHTDILDVMLGPITSGHIHLERSGCKTGAAAKPAPPAAAGADPAPSASAPPPAT